MEVTQQDRCLSTRHHQNQSNQKQQREHIVEHMGPDGVENEEELDEDTAKRQHASHQNTGQWFRPETLLRDSSGDGVGSDRVLNDMFLESKVRADESQRNRDAKPQTDKSAQSQEGNGSRTALRPQENVEEKHDGKYHSGAKKRSQQHVGVPFQTSEHLETLTQVKTKASKTVC